MQLGTLKQSASEMKVLVLLICAVAGASAGALAWPGAVPFTSTQYRTIIPGQVKGFGYSTSQYINAIPTAPIGYQPQIGYQISIPSYNPQPIVQPILGASYFPSNNFLYPSFPPTSIVPVSPIAPVAPVQPPVQGAPAPAEQPGGDEDTAVVDSAEFSPNQQFPQSSQPQPPNFSQPSLDTKNMPGFPQIPQAPQQLPSFPQAPQQIPSFPQAPQQIPSFPQFPPFPQVPQQIPSFPQAPQQTPSFPQAPQQIPSFPQAPQQTPSFPQNPQAPQQIPSLPQIPQYQPPVSNPQPTSPTSPQPPSFFPGADNSNQGLNDEDTVSVESA